MVVTFSIKEHDVTNKKLVEDLKEECSKKGLNFSYIVLEALKSHLEAKND